MDEIVGYRTTYILAIATELSFIHSSLTTYITIL